jgi:signal transduction histidine kinase/CheY-like chemotaxis protein
VATAIHVMFALLSWGTDASKLLTAQLLVSVLAQLFFLRVTNNMIGKLLKIRHENTELVGVLQQKNTALEQSNLSQSRYLSAASHDLRQPLHALALLTNDAQRKNQVPAVGETLKKIDLAIDSLSQSFNAMLNLSRLDAGVVKPEFTRFPIQRLFNRLQIEFADTAAAKGLSFNVRSSRAWVLSDEGMLYSILSNFVSNALRYTDEGGVLVGVRAINAQTLRLMVYDTGSGVPTEKARQIFQEYLRLEDAQQRVQGGVGLGLAISERMARLLGAKLLVQSVMKQGSSFGLIVSQVEPLEESSHLAMARIDTEDRLAGVRVAIVDDDETALESLGELLESWGMDVTEVLSAEMLRESVTEEGAFDMVISDYHLSIPDENGLDIICAARKLPGMATAHCLLLTGDTSTELAAAVQTTGAVIWYKPLRPARLRAYLNTIMKDAA